MSIYVYIYIYTIIVANVCISPLSFDKFMYIHDDDVVVKLEYYSGKGFHINYSCLNVLRKYINSSNKA
jgi:hypothetical protein